MIYLVIFQLILGQCEGYCPCFSGIGWGKELSVFILNITHILEI